MYMYLSFKKSCLSAPKATAFNQQKSYAFVICMHRFLFMHVELWDCCSSPVLPLGKIPKHLEQGDTSVFSCLFVFPLFQEVIIILLLGLKESCKIFPVNNNTIIVTESHCSLSNI